MQYNVAKLDAVDEDLNMLMMNIISMPNSLVNMVGNRFPPLWGASALINTGGGALGYFLYVSTAVAPSPCCYRPAFNYTGLLAGNAHPSQTRRSEPSMWRWLNARAYGLNRAGGKGSSDIPCSP